MAKAHPAEEWRLIAGANAYEVSNLGRVRRGFRLHKLSRATSKMGYLRATLRFDDGRKRVVYVHHLVAEAFLGARPTDLLALHIDGNVLNCRANNLYWGTYADNGGDRVRHGRSGKGTNNPNVKLPSDAADAIRSMYRTTCLTQSEIGEVFRVSQSHVSRIVRGLSWENNE